MNSNQQQRTNNTMLNHDGNTVEALLEKAREFSKRGPLQTTLESFPLFLVMLMAFLGNSLVLWAVKCNARLRTTPNYYVTALALINVLMSILIMPLSLSVLIASHWPFNEGSCLYHGYTATTLGSASLLILTLTSVNRYFKVVRPNQYRAYFKVMPVLISLTIAWIIALAWPVYFLVIGIFSYHPGKFRCIYDLDQVTLATGLAVNITFAIVTFTVIAFSYFRIFLMIRKHNANLNNRDPSSPKISSKDLSVTKLLFAVVVVYVFCWLPLLVVDTTEMFTGQYVFPRQVYQLYSYTVGVNSAVNPIVYAFFNREFKTEFKRILGKFGGNPNRVAPPVGRAQAQKVNGT